MRLASAAIAVLLLFEVAYAVRLVPAWSIEELFTRSDVVVIAFPIAVHRKPDRDSQFIDRQDRDHLTTIETTFKLVVPLKGKTITEQFGVFHCEIKAGSIVPDNGPNLPRFASKIALHPEKSTCILFLKRNGDGTLEFVTGRYDSVFSVKELKDFPADESYLPMNARD